MKIRAISIIVLVAYFALLIKIMILKDLDTIRVGQLMFNFGGTLARPANWTPFATIIPYLMGEKGFLIGAINILGNILLLVPIGFFMPIAAPKVQWKSAVVFGIFLAFMIEFSQVFFQVGIFDIDDVILNVVGLVSGFATYQFLPKFGSKNIVWISIIGFVLLMVYVGTPMQKHFPLLPLGFGKGVQHPLHKNEKHPLSQENAPNNPLDPCGGTGGIGIITHLKANSFLIQSNRNGDVIEVHFSTNSTFKNASGEIQFKDLRLGNAVTLIGGPSGKGQFQADVVLVCQ